MGGCRCTFRGCPNNSANSPGMHFFHYPLKHPERLQFWIKYGDTKDILDMPFNKARNKVVCESHFRDECFMNYKKERLVQSAIPTLVRLPTGLVLDYEESDEPEPKVLKPTKSAHLICPSNLSGSKTSSIRQSHTSNSNASLFSGDEFVIETLEFPDSGDVQTKKRTYPRFKSEDDSDSPTKISKQAEIPRILNSSLQSYSGFKKKIKQSQNFHTVETTLSPKVSRDDFTNDSDVHCEEITIDTFEEVEHFAESVDKRDEGETVEVTETEIQLQLNKQEEPKSPEAEKVSKAFFDEVILDYEERIKNLKEMLQKKEAAEKARNTQVETVSTSRQATGSGGSVLMTKAQIFNSIKKYLSPSMGTLVRMEMFGGPERQWKPDEKQVSVELFKLGEYVFDYFRDEWRFRLPPKKDVQQWVASSKTDMDDEEDL